MLFLTNQSSHEATDTDFLCLQWLSRRCQTASRESLTQPCIDLLGLCILCVFADDEQTDRDSSFMDTIDPFICSFVQSLIVSFVYSFVSLFIRHSSTVISMRSLKWNTRLFICLLDGWLVCLVFVCLLFCLFVS